MTQAAFKGEVTLLLEWLLGATESFTFFNQNFGKIHNGFNGYESRNNAMGGGGAWDHRFELTREFKTVITCWRRGFMALFATRSRSCCCEPHRRRGLKKYKRLRLARLLTIPLQGCCFFGCGLRHFVVEFHHGLNLRMDLGIPDLTQQAARGPIGGKRLISRIPFPKPCFSVRIRIRPAFRFCPQAAAPGLRCQSGPVALLALAKFLVKRIGTQRLEHVLGKRGIRVNQRLGGQQAQAGASPVNPPAPIRMVARPVLDSGNGRVLRTGWRRSGRLSNKFFEQASPGSLGVLGDQYPQTSRARCSGPGSRRNCA